MLDLSSAWYLGGLGHMRSFKIIPSQQKFSTGLWKGTNCGQVIFARNTSAIPGLWRHCGWPFVKKWPLEVVCGQFLSCLVLDQNFDSSKNSIFILTQKFFTNFVCFRRFFRLRKKSFLVELNIGFEISPLRKCFFDL